MNFNPEYIKQLAEGGIILQHTKLPKDLPLLVEIIKHIFPKDSEPTGDTNFYFRLSKGQWGGLTDVPIEHINKPIIPLHDFVSPTKEEKITIDTIDARLKRLEEIFNQQADPTISAKEEQPKAEWTPKVGEWFKNDLGVLFLCVEGEYGLINGDTQNDEYIISFYTAQWLTKPTEQEVGDYLIGLAKAKGFKAGIEIDQSKWGGFKVKLGEVDFNYNNGNLHLGGLVIWYKGTWAEVLPQAKEGFDVDVKFKWLDDLSGHYYIRVGKATGLTQSEAEKYAETIKNALNHG